MNSTTGIQRIVHEYVWGKTTQNELAESMNYTVTYPLIPQARFVFISLSIILQRTSLTNVHLSHRRT